MQDSGSYYSDTGFKVTILKTIANNRHISKMKIFSLRMLLWVNRGLSIVLYLTLTVIFVCLLGFLVYENRMNEVDVAMRYLLIPVYVFSILFSASIAKRKIEFRILKWKKREPESRWALKSEIKDSDAIESISLAEEEYSSAGIPFFIEDSNVYLDNGEAHSLIIGSTGSGKTRRLVLPLINILARKGESVIMTDPKGELYGKTKTLFEKCGYKTISINLREPAHGNAWNPLSIPYEYYKSGNKDKAMELVRDLGLNIFYDKSNTEQDPFWEQSAANYFTGLALALFDDASEDEINLNSIISMSAQGQEKYGATDYLKTYFGKKDKASVSYISAAGTVHAPNETKGSILSTFGQKISIYSSQAELSKMLSYSDFNVKDIGNEKTAVFIIMQDEKSTYHPLVSAFIKQSYEVLIGQAHINDGELPIRVNLVLDEFANLPPIADIGNMITAARSRKIRLYLIVQGAKQLAAQYDDNTAEVIRGNCSNWFFLISKELQLLRDISELCGITEGKNGIFDAIERPLVSISELQRLEVGEIIIRRDREHPFRTKLPDISEYSAWKDDISLCEGSIELKETRQDVVTFDLIKYVKQKQQESLAEMLSQNSGLEVENSLDPLGLSSQSVNTDDAIDSAVKDEIEKLGKDT